MNWDGVKSALSKGWIKDLLMDSQGRVCLRGACLVAEGARMSNGDLNYDGAQFRAEMPYAEAMAKVIREQFPERMYDDSGSSRNDVAFFNNDYRTTLDDVMLVVEKAAAESP